MRQICDRLALIVLTIAPVSCSPILPRVEYTTHSGPKAFPKIYGVVLDDTFTPEDSSAIRSALSNWNIALNENIELTTDSNGPKWDNIWYVQNMSEGTCVLTLACQSDKGRALGFVDMLGGHKLYLIPSRVRSPSELTFVTMHEIGHLFGLEHNPNTLMDLYFNRRLYSCVDPLTAWAVARTNNLDYGAMNWCTP